ncbi:MAG: type II toxin-antitoxin system RelE/ParE family toxin [Alphaproteobacteria bacterium]|nr:type II toxin-antitoxin system RelE/ParE family toxin [Alphaproteobacteria bacterium]
MNWDVQFLPEAEKDFSEFSKHHQLIITKAITKVSQNPLPQNEGGYGKPLGNKRQTNLAGFLKIKLRNDGIRIVYKLIRTETQMLVVIIGMREDEKVYTLAQKRIVKHKL